jgi:hypothetical protein
MSLYELLVDFHWVPFAFRRNRGVQNDNGEQSVRRWSNNIAVARKRAGAGVYI